MKTKKIIIDILIAEDSPTQAEQLKHILEENNYKVIVAKDGKEALDLIQKVKPSIIISDIIMPKMNGYELCEKIKADISTKDIPVILLTSLSDSSDVIKGLACGADNFLTKPYNEQYLLSHIAQVLVNKKMHTGEIVRLGIEMVLGGKKRFITSTHQQMLSLLISTYEAAVQRNHELLETQEELKSINNHLETLVEERTAELVKEISIRKNSEEFNKRIISSSSDCINALDLKGNLLSMSEGGQTLMEIDDIKQYLNKSWLDFWKGDDHKAALKAIAKAKKGESAIFTGFCLTEKGTPKWWEIIVSPIKDAQGKIYNLLAVSRDITERKQAQGILEENEERYRQIFQFSPDSIIIHDMDMNILDVNNKAVEYFGYSKEELIEKKIYELHPESELKHSEQVLAEIKKESMLNVETKFIRKDGSVFLAEETPCKYMLGSKLIIHVVIRDITERKRSEQIQKILYNISKSVITSNNLEELVSLIRQELGTLIDTSNFYIALYNDKTDTFLLPFLVNEKESFTSFPAGKTFTNYVRKTQKSLLANKETIKELIKTKDIEMIGTASEIWLGVPLKIEDKVTGVLAVQSYTNKNAYNEADMEMLEFVSDQIGISIERKKAEQDLIMALEKATESDRLKSAFLSTMSHELRTPLNAIIGFSQFLDKNCSIEDVETFGEVIKSSGYHLLGIVEDIFDITLIESGVININKKEIPLQSFLNIIYSTIKVEQEKTAKNHIDINLIIPPDCNELTIYTDQLKLSQILINLLKNALKFTNEGHINFGFSIEKDQDKPTLKFYVKDTGIGIQEDNQEIIFDIFRQADDSHTRQHDGIGIGLSIAKKLTEKLGGKIWVESSLGKGSTFYFTIPFESQAFIDRTKETMTIVEELEKNKLDNKTILVVEDVESNFKFLKLVLKKSGMNTIWAKNGQEAIRYCLEEPDIALVLMDLKMPVMNGYDATKEIKRLIPGLPIIAQTAFATAGDKEKILEAGCDDYIAKPIDKEILLGLIEKYID